jgi:hypothetical protein
LVTLITGICRDPSGQPVSHPNVVIQYKSLLGAPMHVANCTRLDIALAVSYSARFLNSVTTNKFARVVDVIK